MTKTTNFQLNQWEASDYVRRTDFNEDNAKIDAALGNIPQLELGTYTGDGTASRMINLGYTPRAVYVAAADGMAFRQLNGSGQLCGGLALLGHPCYDTVRNRVVLEICENGFKVNYSVETTYYVYTNTENTEYRYIALK